MVNLISNKKIKYLDNKLSSLLILIGCFCLSQDILSDQRDSNNTICDEITSEIATIAKRLNFEKEAELKRLINNLNDFQKIIDLSNQYLKLGGTQKDLLEGVTEELVEKITDNPLNFHKKVIVATEQQSVTWFNNHLKNPQYKEELESYLFTDHPQTIKILLEAGVNPNIKDQTGHTPLHLAVKRMDINTVKRLLNNHAAANATIKPDVLTWEKTSKVTPLLLALKELKNSISKSGTVIKLSMLDKYYQLIEALLKGGADPRLKDDEGKNSINIAENILNDIRWINLEKTKNLNISSQLDESFAQNPAEVKMRSIITMLVKYGAKPKNAYSFFK